MARGAQLITIYWRDIPAQVNAKSRQEKHQVLLKPRFQKAIDRAAMVADITTSSAYVNEWRQEKTPLKGEPAAVAAALAEELDSAFPIERLDEFVRNGGFAEPRLDSAEPDATASDADGAEADGSETSETETA